MEAPTLCVHGLVHARSDLGIVEAVFHDCSPIPVRQRIPLQRPAHPSPAGTRPTLPGVVLRKLQQGPVPLHSPGILGPPSGPRRPRRGGQVANEPARAAPGAGGAVRLHERRTLRPARPPHARGVCGAGGRVLAVRPTATRGARGGPRHRSRTTNCRVVASRDRHGGGDKSRGEAERGDHSAQTILPCPNERHGRAHGLRGRRHAGNPRGFGSLRPRSRRSEPNSDVQPSKLEDFICDQT